MKTAKLFRFRHEHSGSVSLRFWSQRGRTCDFEVTLEVSAQRLCTQVCNRSRDDDGEPTAGLAIARKGIRLFVPVAVGHRSSTDIMLILEQFQVDRCDSSSVLAAPELHVQV